MKISSTFAHAKGLIGVDKENAILIIHSIPHFVNVDDGILDITIDINQTKFGQHVFCVNLDY